MDQSKEERKEIIKDLIKRLHAGESEEIIKAEFKLHFQNVSGNEIAEAEKLLMAEGVKLEEVESLCSVHASMFDDLVEINDEENYLNQEGHPLFVIEKENVAIVELLEKTKENYNSNKVDMELLKAQVKDLLKLDIHYLKKENLIFPFLEKHEVSGPSKVMWSVDDKIRKLVKKAYHDLKDDVIDEETYTEMFAEIEEMVFKERNILTPMTLESFSKSEWQAMANDLNDIGFSLIKKDFADWVSGVEADSYKKSSNAQISKDMLQFETGSMTVEVLNALLNALPVDITFVDKDDRFSFFSNGSERIFTRTKTSLGRDVSNCHPANSVHMVEKIIKDFRSGASDVEEFWLEFNEMFVYIRYFALRSENNEYLGTLEVSQNIAPLKKIEGQKRIL